jgi:hypothetical protein
LKKRKTGIKYFWFVAVLFILILFVNSISSASALKSWLNNSKFDSSEDWGFQVDGDESDVNGSIEDGYAKLKVIGDGQSQNFFENGTGWTVRENSLNIPRPDDEDIRDGGWWAMHTWPDNQPQFLLAQ